MKDLSILEFIKKPSQMEQTPKPTILIVDDQQQELDVLRIYLHTWGLRIAVAQSGE